MITGCLQQKSGFYYAVLYLKVNGRRRCKWVPMRLPVEGTSARKAQKSSINRGINNAPAFRLQFSKIEKQVRVCEFSNRTLLLLLHLPLKIVQRLDMPEAFAGDGTEGQRTEKVD